MAKYTVMLTYCIYYSTKEIIKPGFFSFQLKPIQNINNRQVNWKFIIQH